MNRFRDPWNEIEVQHQVYSTPSISSDEGDSTSLDRAAFGRCMVYEHLIRNSARYHSARTGDRDPGESRSDGALGGDAARCRGCIARVVLVESVIATGRGVGLFFA
jgi:hypothetical protein